MTSVLKSLLIIDVIHFAHKSLLAYFAISYNKSSEPVVH